MQTSLWLWLWLLRLRLRLLLLLLQFLSVLMLEAIAGYALRILKPDGRTVFVKPTKAVLRSAAPAGRVKGVIGSFDDESDDEPEDAGYEIVDGW